MATRQKSRVNPLLIVLLSFVCILLIGFGILLFLYSANTTSPTNTTVDPTAQIRSIFRVEGLDPNAKSGTMPGAPENETSPGDGMFSYRINATPQFQQDGADGNIWVQNPAFNDYLMVLEIADENGELLYQSQYIAPNQYIERIDLLLVPPPGTYQMVAYINAVEPRSLDLIDTLECPLTITIQ